MLSWAAVTKARLVLGTAMEDKASRYGGYLRRYRISSSGQQTRVGVPAWGLNGGLTSPHRKSNCYYILHRTSDGFFGTT